MNTSFIISSALLTAISVSSSVAEGNTILVWVTTVLNAIILISNTALAIYRSWRDKDKDTSGVPTININSSTPSDNTADSEDKADEGEEKSSND